MLEIIRSASPLLSRLYTGVCLSSLNQSTSLTASPGRLLVMLHGRDTELPTMLDISVTAPLSRLAMALVSCLVSQEIANKSTVTSVTLLLSIIMTVITVYYHRMSPSQVVTVTL